MFKQKNTIIIFSFCLAAIMTMGAGCSISFKNNDTSAIDGGFWASLDKGVTWRQVSAVPTVSGVPGSIASYDDYSFAIDPQDSNALYFGSLSKGLYYTYDVGAGWFQAASLQEVKINSIAVSPDDKCLIYVTAGNKVYRSSDCSRTWQQIYFDNETSTQIKSVAVDQYDAKWIYIGNSRGDIMRSTDRGDHWVTVLRSGSSINQIVFSPKDSRVILITTVSEGIYRSTDSGDNWKLLKDKMTEFKNSFNIVSLVASPENDGLFFAATTYGLLKSNDKGDSWTRINLITPEKEASINSLAVNPKNQKEIYYVTNTTFYSSFDGGASWRTKKLPSTRAGWRLMVDPDETNAIFMTMKKYQNSTSNGMFGI